MISLKAGINGLFYQRTEGFSGLHILATETVVVRRSLMKGPYQASAKLSQSKNHDEYGKIEISWENEYRGKDPCGITLSHTYPGDIYANYACDDGGYVKNANFELPYNMEKIGFAYNDYEKGHSLKFDLNQEQSSTKHNFGVLVSVDLDDNADNQIPLLSQEGFQIDEPCFDWLKAECSRYQFENPFKFAPHWNLEKFNPKSFWLSFGFENDQDVGGFIEVAPLRLDWKGISGESLWCGAGNGGSITLGHTEDADSSEQFEHLPAQLNFNLCDDKSSLSMKTSSPGNQLDLSQVAIQYSVADDQFKLAIDSPISSSDRMNLKFSHQLSDGNDAYS